MLLKCTQY